MESLLRSNSNEMIVTKFCAWHDSYVIVSCAKKMLQSDDQEKKNFHRIVIVIENSCFF